jgi:hypothetical protein
MMSKDVKMEPGHSLKRSDAMAVPLQTGQRDCPEHRLSKRERRSANGAMGQAGKGTALLPFVGVHEPADDPRNLTASVPIAASPALCGNNNAGGL